MEDGLANPLFVDGRDSSLAAGEVLHPSEIGWSQARDAGVFTTRNQSEIAVTFGGASDSVAFFGRGSGALEQQPHNVIHMAVGGLMRNPVTAALDPLFWLHHCNIDRLWEVWNRSGGANTTSLNWINQTFDFFDIDGSPVTDVNNAVQDLSLIHI